MSKTTSLTSDDYNDFLVYLYFGSGPNYLDQCMHRAYLDFRRTLRLTAKQLSDSTRKTLYTRARERLTQSLNTLKLEAEGVHQDTFDAWHEQTCCNLIDTYQQNRYTDFTIGQAQKWINMTLKYVFTLGEKRISGFQPVYSLCHIPIDNIIVDHLVNHGFSSLPNAWSRLNDYRWYLDYQKQIRDRFPYPPLDVEFRLWMGKSL